jgi:hypothetical protein
VKATVAAVIVGMGDSEICLLIVAFSLTESKVRRDDSIVVTGEGEHSFLGSLSATSKAPKIWNTDGKSSP